MWSSCVFLPLGVGGRDSTRQSSPFLMVWANTRAVSLDHTFQIAATR